MLVRARARAFGHEFIMLIVVLHSLGGLRDALPTSCGQVSFHLPGHVVAIHESTQVFSLSLVAAPELERARAVFISRSYALFKASQQRYTYKCTHTQVQVQVNLSTPSK